MTIECVRLDELLELHMIECCNNIHTANGLL